MRLTILIIVIITIFPHCKETVSPTLLPSTVEKTIKRFNYCLNNIDREDIFGSLSQIMTGKAEEEFEELRILINKNRREKTADRENIDRYREYAKNLKIKVLSIKINNNDAVALTLFFNINVLAEDRRKIILKKMDELWKIAEITIVKNN